MQSLAAAKLLPEQKEEVVEIVTSWERKGIEKGRLEGAVEALQAVLLDVIVSRFDVEPESVAARVHGLTSVDDLRQLTHRALTVRTFLELDL